MVQSTESGDADLLGGEQPSGGDVDLLAGEQPQGDVYTMAEAARLKGVSYHTVSRAVRRGKLPVTRLGRMALISAEELRAWRPMRERAPRKYRRREPMPDATPALLDLASSQRVDLAQRLSTLYEVIHGAAAALPLAEFLQLLADRFSDAFGFRRFAIWAIDERRETATRLAWTGAPFSDYADEMPLAQMPILQRWASLSGPEIIDDLAGINEILAEAAAQRHITSLFGAPLRIGERVVGALVGDRDGESFTLTRDQLALAQVLANQAALAIEQARLRDLAVARGNQLAAIVEELSEAVRACDADLHLTISNAADRALFGLDGERIEAGMDILPLLNRIERREFDGRPIPAEQDPLLLALGGERVHRRDYLIIRPSDRAPRAISVSARPLLTNNDVIGAVAVARDITDERDAARHEAERRIQLETDASRAGAVADVALAVNTETDVRNVLQTAITRMTALLDGTSGALFLRELDGRLVTAAAYRCELLAEDRWELPVDTVSATRAALARRAPRYLSYAGAAASERSYFDRWRIEAALIVPLTVRDELIGVAYINYDTAGRAPDQAELAFAATLARQCAAAIEKTRLVAHAEAAHRRLLQDDFLSIVAHELRNPLTSLRGNLQLLQRRIRRADDDRRAEEVERLETAIDQVDHVSELVSRLLDVSRAELGKLDLSLGPADAAAIVRAAAEGGRGLIRGRSIVVQAPERCLVVWDEVRIEQVLNNLISNAGKYAPEGPIEIRLDAPAEGPLRISVRDHGPGVPDTVKTRLFDRYYRAGDEPAGNGQGLGLGLYISRKIALRHGGDLTVADAPGGGASFTLALPRDAGTERTEDRGQRIEDRTESVLSPVA